MTSDMTNILAPQAPPLKMHHPLNKNPIKLIKNSIGFWISVISFNQQTVFFCMMCILTYEVQQLPHLRRFRKFCEIALKESLFSRVRRPEPKMSLQKNSIRGAFFKKNTKSVMRYNFQNIVALRASIRYVSNSPCRHLYALKYSLPLLRTHALSTLNFTPY